MTMPVVQASLQKTPSLPDLQHIPPLLQPKYRGMLGQFPEVLFSSTYDVGHATVLPQDIVLKHHTQIASTPPYCIPEHLQQVVRGYIKNLENAHIIRPSTSPFSSPLMLVRKMGATPDRPFIEQYRVVHDYWQLNQNTVRDCYPMCNLYELLGLVAQAKISGFWNQELTERSRPYTAFGVPGIQAPRVSPTALLHSKGYWTLFYGIYQDFTSILMSSQIPDIMENFLPFFSLMGYLRIVFAQKKKPSYSSWKW